MPTITILPHPQHCPDGAVFEAQAGDNLIEALLAHGVEIEHACERSCACTTCHVIIRNGLNSLAEAEELEEDMLDKAWGLTLQSRLSCQVVVGEQNLLIEIPKYTINLASEAH